MATKGIEVTVDWRKLGRQN